MRHALLFALLFMLALGPATTGAGTASDPAWPKEARAYPGRIEAVTSAGVSNAISSLVTEVHFGPGQLVEKGQVLYRLDPTDFQLAVQTERANLLRTRTAQTSAHDDFDRLTRLRARGAATEVQMLKAEVAMAFADAALAKAHADLESAEVALARTTITAPISGIIGPSAVAIGTFVKAGDDPLAMIVQLDPVRVAYDIPYADRIDELLGDDLRFPDSVLNRIRIRLRLSDTLTYPIETTPRTAAATVDPATGGLTLWAEIANPLGHLRPGMRVTVLSRIVDEAGAN